MPKSKKLTEITPPKYKNCDFEASCPAVFKKDKKTFVIIGKTVKQLENGLTVIEIDQGLLEELEMFNK